MPNELWTEEEDEILRQTVNGNLSYKQISQQFLPHRPPDGIRYRATEKLNLDNTGYFGKSRRVNFHNKDFWKIPNPINCYWAGFSAADGCVTNRGGKNHFFFNIELSDRDHNHLETLKSQIEYTGIVKSYHGSSFLNLSCGSEWFNDLRENFGIIPNKTKILLPPNLPDYLEWCYLIGYIDGDGCIRLDKKDKMRINLVSCSKAILDWVCKKTGIFVGARKHKRRVKNYNTYHRFNIDGEAGIKLFQFLKDFPVPKLDRKWKSPRIEEVILRKYPHLLK